MNGLDLSRSVVDYKMNGKSNFIDDDDDNIEEYS